MTFPELIERHGSADLIPNEDLYRFLLHIREDLVNRQDLGADKLKESALGKEVRRRSKQDLVWLAGYFTWETNPFGVGKDISENTITEESHGVICRKFFVQKDDSKPLADQSPIKNRLILWPRGGLKTSLDIADTIQWILNFPDIRILFLSAGSDFSTDILDETKGHFVVKEGEPSLMNLFFPEFCVEEKNMGAAGEFVSPVWAAKQVRRREPTILGAGIDSTLSGKHFELIKGDDMVSNRNSENEDQCRKVTKNFGINRKMLMPFGYVDLIGTRYADVDMYGEIIAKNEESMKGNQFATHEQGQGWELFTNPDASQIILIGRAIQIKPEVAEQLEREGKDVTYVNAGEDGCILLLPKMQTYRFLCGDYAADEIAFEGQRNQNPKPAVAVTFDRPLLLRSTIPWNELPVAYQTTQFWDTAYSRKKGRDYSTGSTVRWDAEGKMYVVDLVREKLKPADLAKTIVAAAVKHKPQVVGIEDAAGVRYNEAQLQIEARRTNDPYIIDLFNRIVYLTPSNQKEAKKSRMAALHPWLVDGRMKIWNGLPHLEYTYSEFERSMNSHHHDDVVDTLSYQPMLAPRIDSIPLSNGADLWNGPFDKQTWLLQRGWNLIYEEDCDAFGTPGAGRPSPLSLLAEFTEPVEEDFRAGPLPGGMAPILGAGLD